MKTAMEKLDMLVVIDPFPTMSAVMHDRKDGVYLLPATTQFETYGSVTASNRSMQWREQVIDPLFESKTDHEIMSTCSRTSSASPTSSSRTSRSRARSLTSRTSPASSTAACGRSAIPASRRSA
jgi:anaerobic selenocysteine-containing dehydrogenase